MSQRRRILLVAHHCNPEWGSEPLIGWRWAHHLSRQAEVTLVTHVRNRPALERAEGAPPTIHYVDTEKLAARVNWINSHLWAKAAVVNKSLLEIVSLNAFDKAACRIAEPLCAQGAIDLIHRVSPISPRARTRLGSLGVPFVLGPVNGGMRTAPGFLSVARRERAWAQALRPLARLFDPFQRTFRDARSVLSANRTTLSVIPERDQARTTLMCENAVEVDQFEPVYARSGPTLRLLYLGRLLPYKGVEYALRALARLPQDLDVRLDVVGDGADRARLEGIAAELELGARVAFHGACAVDEVPGWMKGCDLFLLPSVRESGGSVNLEAMACGKPALVAGHGGPAETVDESVGRVLPATSEADLIAALSAAIEELARDEKMRERLGRAARAHIERHYTWAGKAARALELYEELLGGGRPDSGPEATQRRAA